MEELRFYNIGVSCNNSHYDSIFTYPYSSFIDFSNLEISFTLILKQKK